MSVKSEELCAIDVRRSVPTDATDSMFVHIWTDNGNSHHVFPLSKLSFVKECFDGNFSVGFENGSSFHCNVNRGGKKELLTDIKVFMVLFGSAKS